MEMTIEKNQPTTLAYRRLILVLDTWNKEKAANNYQWLYVCARDKGQKLKSIWVSANSETVVTITNSFKEVLTVATSFEIEFLWEKESRILALNNKNQWNSLRGKRALEIKSGGKDVRWSALEMIALNLSFNKAIQRYFEFNKNHKFSTSSVTACLYKTKQYYCDNRIFNADIASLEMFRGNRVVKMDTISQESVLQSVKGMTYWLSAQVKESGQTNYKYWPSRGSFANSNNAIRQWMATICLNRAASVFSDINLKKTAAKNLSYNIKSMFKWRSNFGYIFLDGSAKLGAAALAALAIFESPKRKDFLKEEYALYELLNELSNSDGSFDTFLIPRERKDNQNFYSGEALLFLATRYSVSRNPDELKRILSAFKYYRMWHRENRNPAFIPWHTQAYYLVWKITKDNALKDFIFEMNDWLLSMQQWDSAEYPDMQGRFYDPKRSHFGPPHASSTGVYLEGLIDAFLVAKECGDKRRLENYRIAIVRGMRSIIQLQFKDEPDCFYIKNVDRVLGGLRTTVYDNTIRIDNVQHALMALFKIMSRFSEEDYTIVVQSTLADVSSVQGRNFNDYKFFKKIEFPIPLGEIRCEIEKNDTLWLANTSRQDNVKVQNETNTIFLRSTKKPFVKKYSGNDIQASNETVNAKRFPLLMKTLNTFSKSIQGDLSRVTIVRLQPNGTVYPHIDEGEYYRYRNRYHIVVRSPSGSVMTSGDETVCWHEGEFWWFDNKAMHSASNSSNEYRVHIIFDVLPNESASQVKDLTRKQSLLSHPTKSILSDTAERMHVSDSLWVDFPKYKRTLHNQMPSECLPGYQSNEVYLDVFKESYIYGNKFVIANRDSEVYQETLPTYYHKPEFLWLDRKPFVRDALYENDILRIDGPCAVISNSNWKNYWHWHAQCLTSVELLKKTGWWGKVKILVPPLTDWRRNSLRALGIEDSMCIKVKSNILYVDTLIRPSFLNKTNQIYMHPSVQGVFNTIKSTIVNADVEKKPGRKLYVARFDASARRLHNERQLADFLAMKGFEIVVPGELSYVDQVRVFSEASLVVGPHGAGLTNIGFCSEGAVIVELFSEEFFYPEKFAYMAHASLNNLRYECFVSVKADDDVSYWVVDVESFFGVLGRFLI